MGSAGKVHGYRGLNYDVFTADRSMVAVLVLLILCVALWLFATRPHKK